MLKRIGLILWLCGIALLARAEDNTPASADVRILVDVSGSMKKTDPLNLRIPAARLLISLLPPDAQASLWLFADQPQLLLPLGKTDQAWKNQAVRDVAKIHSRGQFTHIEAILDEALEGWKQVSQFNGKRHVILLTDGMVDISKNPKDSIESRQRIISEIIPRLQQLGVQVHTIALSEQADMDLLRRLSQDTGGWHEAIQMAEQLERVFAKLATKTAPQEGVPLQGNRFTIDSSIQEFTLLVFLDPKNPQATHLLKPDKQLISETALQPNVHWRHEAGYDLITIDHPQPGEWRLDAKTDPDNHIMVVTDLKMVVKDLPNYLSQGDPLPIQVHFTDRDGEITQEDFLSLIEVKLQRDGHDESVPRDSGRQGYFNLPLKDLALGKHSLTVTADGKTFKREVNHALEVVERLISASTQLEPNSNPAQLRFTLTANTAVLDSKATQVIVKLSNAFGQSTDMPMQGDNAGHWILRLPVPSAQELLTLNFVVNGKTLQGKDVRPSLPPIVLNAQALAQLTSPPPPPPPPPPAPVVEPPKPVEAPKAVEHTPPPEPAHHEEKPVEHTPEHAEHSAPEPEPAHAPEEALAEAAHPDKPTDSAMPGWVMTLGLAGVINLLLFGGGWYGYRAYQKRSANKREALLAELDDSYSLD